MTHAFFRRPDQAQRGRAASHRPGAVRRRRRASRHAARRLPAQPGRAWRGSSSSTSRAAQARPGVVAVYTADDLRRLLAAVVPCWCRRRRFRARSSTSAPRCRSPGTRCATSASRSPSSLPRAATLPKTRSTISRSSSSRCRRWSISKRRSAPGSALVHDDLGSNICRAGPPDQGGLPQRGRKGAPYPKTPFPLRARHFVHDRDARRGGAVGCAQPAHDDLGHDAGAGVRPQRAWPACSASASGRCASSRPLSAAASGRKS